MLAALLQSDSAGGCLLREVLNPAWSVNWQGCLCVHIALHVTSVLHCKWSVNDGSSPRRADFNSLIVHVELVVQGVLV